MFPSCSIIWEVLICLSTWIISWYMLSWTTCFSLDILLDFLNLTKRRSIFSIFMFSSLMISMTEDGLTVAFLILLIFFFSEPMVTSISSSSTRVSSISLSEISYWSDWSSSNTCMMFLSSITISTSLFSPSFLYKPKIDLVKAWRLSSLSSSLIMLSINFETLFGSSPQKVLWSNFLLGTSVKTPARDNMLLHNTFFYVHLIGVDWLLMLPFYDFSIYSSIPYILILYVLTRWWFKYMFITHAQEVKEVIAFWILTSQPSILFG